MKTIYVETSIPSFYFEVRTEPDMIARRDWTREWWDKAITEEELVTSQAVVGELQRGTFPNQGESLNLIQTLPSLNISDAILEIADTYIAHRIMPNDPSGDALHLALASYYGCDMLATWNCRHLANANKFGHIERINGIMKLKVPLLVTPIQLLGKQDY